MKHFYRELQGWFGARELYRAMVKRSANKATFVEIGAWKGQSAAFMAVEIINSGKDIQFHVIDTWKGSEEHWDPKAPSFEPVLAEKGTIFPIFKQNLAPVWDKIKPIQLASLEAVDQFKDESLDFVYIDAAHDYENAKADIQSWLPKVRKTGIIAGDDYGWAGVAKAVKEIFGDRFIVEANNNWINSQDLNFDYECFLKTDLKKQTFLQKITSYLNA